jgi:small-conductance mechanosensitive channel
VLETPAPSLTLEGIEGGLLIFQAIAYVPSPRLAGGVRSDLLFTILERMRAERIELVPYAAVAPPVAASDGTAPTAA